MGLQISSSMHRRLIETGILEEDVLQVFTAEGGILDPQSGTVMRGGRIGSLTLWLEMRPAEDGYRLENVYCHRMSVDGVALCPET